MAPKRPWEIPHRTPVGPHEVIHMSILDENTHAGVSWAASRVPRHYISPEKIAAVLESLGKIKAARAIEEKLPSTLRTRSGELGEIFATDFATRELGYKMIARLRWKDSREMPMRGDDILGVRSTKEPELNYLKGEVKSRKILSTSVLDQAASALLADTGLPSPHALAFVADRLTEAGESRLAMRINSERLGKSIRPSAVTHLLYTFSGNDPRRLLTKHTEGYHGLVNRIAAGLQVHSHQDFIKKVYEKVITNA